MLLLIAYILYFCVSVSMLYFDLMAAYHLTMFGIGVAAMNILLLVIKPMGAVFHSRTAVMFFLGGVLACAILIDWRVLFTAPLLYLAVRDVRQENLNEVERDDYADNGISGNELHALNKDAFVNPSNVLYETMVGPSGQVEND